MGAPEAGAGRRCKLRPGDQPPLPPRHRLCPLASRQGSEAMHFRPARARAEAVGAQGAVRLMGLLFDTPLIAGLDYREKLIDDAEQHALIARLEAEDLSPFRFHGWLGNRKTRSFGWRYDFDD